MSACTVNFMSTNPAQQEPSHNCTCPSLGGGNYSGSHRQQPHQARAQGLRQGRLRYTVSNLQPKQINTTPRKKKNNEV